MTSSNDVERGFRGLKKEKVHVLLLGHCFFDGIEKHVQKIFARYNIDAKVDVDWPEHAGFDRHTPADVVYFQPWNYTVLGPLFDNGFNLKSGQRQTRLNAVTQWLTFHVLELLLQFKNKLVIVQGLSTPLFLPQGRAEFRRKNGAASLPAGLNQTLCSLMGRNKNAFFVDPAGIFRRGSPARLLDDELSPFSHQGPADKEYGIPFFQDSGPPRETVGSVLAQEILDIYLLWSGRGKIQGLVVDPTDLLWPAALDMTTAEGIFDFFYTFNFSGYAGFHEALRTIKNRGIPLITTSKSTDFRKRWENLASQAGLDGIKHFLGPQFFDAAPARGAQDERNSAGQVEAAARRLKTDPSSLLFISINPSERALVEKVLPDTRTLGKEPRHLRGDLLSNPSLQRNGSETRKKILSGFMSLENI